MCLPSASKRARWHLCELCFNLANRGLHLKHFLIEILQKAELGPNYVKNSLLANKKRLQHPKVEETGLKLAQMAQCAFYPLSQTFILHVKILQNTVIVNVGTLSGSCRFITSWNRVYFLREWVTILLNHLTLLLCLFSAQSLILKMPFNKEFFLIQATYGSSCLRFVFIKWVTSSFKQDSFLFCC